MSGMGTWLFWIAVIALFTWEWWVENWWVVGLTALIALLLFALYHGLVVLGERLSATPLRIAGAFLALLGLSAASHLIMIVWAIS